MLVVLFNDLLTDIILPFIWYPLYINPPPPPCAVHVTFSWWGGIAYPVTRIAMLAGVYTSGKASQVRQVEG